MDEVCPLVKEWKVEVLWLGKYTLYLDYNQSPTILATMKEVRFPNLTKINLRWNNIESVEGINRIYLSKLRWLYIGTNSNI